MLAITVTTVKDGKALVPAINVQGGRVKLSAKKELVTWITIDKVMEVLVINGVMIHDKLEEWLTELGDGKQGVLVNAADCPPLMTLDVQHHIGIGKEALIMLKRWQQAETKDAIVANVAQTLRADFIEESNDAWGFPVVLVRMKVGEVRFCVDNRATAAMSATGRTDQRGRGAARQNAVGPFTETSATTTKDGRIEGDYPEGQTTTQEDGEAPDSSETGTTSVG
ncbi:hypothetical protein L915_21403 [Phytophthora nicotianae]|uniref:Uncharacterized protein n=1 Tax=Phytophthora nicotianae TaxID=4792 RepID=W2FN31_PHYNI|nr:hypothetical protein L915_21403 [Phytophthora nicotianae]